MSRKFSVQYGGDPQIIMDEPGNGVLIGRGTSVPTDATAGYAKGCLWADTDATSGSVFYVNEGSNTSCDFNAVSMTTGVVNQGSPTAETAAATITIADILTGIVTITHATGATVALTLDTGTAMDAGKPSMLGTDQAVDWTVINLSAAAADTATLTAATGHTIVGNAVVQSAHSTTGALYGNSARFRSRRTAANTWVTYRIS